MNKNLIIVGSVVGGAALIAFGLLVGYSGICLISDCETQIEIIVYDPPPWVWVGEKFSAVFTVKNMGDAKAENCVLHWAPEQINQPYVYSEPFTLLPSQEIPIQLETHKGATWRSGGTWEEPKMKSTAWVVCDNTESSKIQKEIGRKRR